MEKPIKNLREVKNSNFGLFYEYKVEKSHLVSFMRKYWLIDIQYICHIKKNKFKPEIFMKLSTNVKSTKKAIKSLKIGTHDLEIEAKEKDYTTTDAKNIISLL